MVSSVFLGNLFYLGLDVKSGTALPFWSPEVSGFIVTRPETKPWEIIQIRGTGGGNKASETQRKISQMLGRQRKSS